MPGLDHIVIKSLAFMQYFYSKIIDDIIMISRFVKYLVKNWVKFYQTFYQFSHTTSSNPS